MTVHLFRQPDPTDRHAIIRARCASRVRPLLRICFLEFRVHQQNSNPRGPATSAGRGLPCISFTAVFAEETSLSRFVLILH